MPLCMYIFPIVQLVENVPAMQETWVQFLGWEDSLEKEMASHSSILVWRIPWTEEPDGPKMFYLNLIVKKQTNPN